METPMTDLTPYTTPVGPRANSNADPDHPVNDLWEALAPHHGPERATELIASYYKAIATGPTPEEALTVSVELPTERRARHRGRRTEVPAALRQHHHVHGRRQRHHDDLRAVRPPGRPHRLLHARRMAVDAMTATEPATRLHQAAAKLRALLAAIATENPADLAAYITAMGPLAGEPLAALLDRWAWLGDKDPDLLNRVGGSEAPRGGRRDPRPGDAPRARLSPARAPRDPGTPPIAPAPKPSRQKGPPRGHPQPHPDAHPAQRHPPRRMRPLVVRRRTLPRLLLPQDVQLPVGIRGAPARAALQPPESVGLVARQKPFGVLWGWPAPDGGYASITRT
jgi:hypothetical protein